MLKLLAFTSWLTLSLILLHITLIAHYGYDCPNDLVVSAHFWPESDYVLIAYTGGYAQLWPVDSAQYPIHTFQFLNGIAGLHSFAISRDGKQFLTASGVNPVKLWDSLSGHLIREFDQEYNDVSKVAFTSDGSGILADTDNWYTYHWDIQTGKLLNKYSMATDYDLELLAPLRLAKQDVIPSPDGKTLLTYHQGRYAMLLNSMTRTPQQVFCPPVVSRSLAPVSLFMLPGLLLLCWRVPSQ